MGRRRHTTLDLKKTYQDWATTSLKTQTRLSGKVTKDKVTKKIRQLHLVIRLCCVCCIVNTSNRCVDSLDRISKDIQGYTEQANTKRCFRNPTGAVRHSIGFLKHCLVFYPGYAELPPSATTGNLKNYFGVPWDIDPDPANLVTMSYHQ